MKNAVLAHIATLEAFQDHIFEQGHTFWHCAMRDTTTGKPFAYYQANRGVQMSTCGNCQKLMELRREIRKLQKQIGVEQTPLRTNITGENVLPRISVNNNSIYNPSYQFLTAR